MYVHRSLGDGGPTGIRSRERPTLGHPFGRFRTHIDLGPFRASQRQRALVYETFSCGVAGSSWAEYVWLVKERKMSELLSLLLSPSCQGVMEGISFSLQRTGITDLGS